MNTKYAPVVIFAYNRPEHLRRSLDSIDKLQEAPFTDLFIYSDAPKTKEQIEQVNKVREVIQEYKERSNYKTVSVYPASANRGLANSIIEGVTEVIKKYEKVIVLEDDLEVSEDFLLYMNKGLQYYESSEDIWALSGYNYGNMESLRNYRHDIYYSGRACSWGWATWINRWNTVDWKVSDYKDIRFNYFKRKKFSLWGADMPYILDGYMYGLNNSWAIRWGYEAWKRGLYTVYPVCSRVKNHGTDGSGTHFVASTSTFSTELYSEKDEAKFEKLYPEKNIQKEFRWKCVNRIGNIRNFIYYTLVRFGLVDSSKRF